ncbi:MAG: DUF1801 domain-containing protein [Candidatus Kerfeldbacteria bacterium]|nr:DUF1801 domain-containing protein [Candidatus Kerfeldbacteria bacterium]
MDTSVKTIKAYIAQYPVKTQTRLRQLYTIIRSVAPDAEESISYGMPAFKLRGKPLVYFGGFKEHVSFFPTSSPIPAFKKELVKYRSSKGTVQFQLNTAIPATLVKKMVKFRMAEIMASTKTKKIKK